MTTDRMMANRKEEKRDFRDPYSLYVIIINSRNPQGFVEVSGGGLFMSDQEVDHHQNHQSS